jgi:hypothetical protein
MRAERERHSEGQRRIVDFFRQGVSYPLWKVGLKEDGSAAEVVAYDGSAARKVKVIVAPGVGPRGVEFITQTSVCYYRLVHE